MEKNQEIEIEYKNLLTKEDFQKLVRDFQLKNAFFTQTNYYFDTPDFALKKKASALRIREKNGTYTMTLKQPHHVGILETNESLSPAEARQILTNPTNLPMPIADLLDDIANLSLLGSLTTCRAETTYQSGTLVLDKSTYLGQTDYEVEFEVTDPEQGEKDFFAFLNRYNIPIRKTDNKVKRFGDRLKQC